MFHRLFLALITSGATLSGFSSLLTPKAHPPVTSPELQVVAPEGVAGKILFTGTVGGIDSIYLLTLPAKKLTKVIDGPGNNSFPVWAPNGKSFAFVSDRDGNKEIYLGKFAADGSVEATRVTTRPEEDDHPGWSPDGQLIAFDSSKDKNADANILTARLSDFAVTVVTRLKGRNTIPKWTPDGKGVTFSTNRFWPGWDVCTYTLASKAESCPLRGLRSFCRAEWSPRAKTLVHSFGAGSQVDLALYDPSTDQSVQIASTGRRSYDATWSSDGLFVAFAGETAQTEVYNLFAVDLRKPDSPKTIPLVKASYSLRYPSWHSEAVK